MDTRLFSIIFDVRAPSFAGAARGCLCYGAVEGARGEPLGASIIRVSAAAAERWASGNCEGPNEGGEKALPRSRVEWIGWREEPQALILAMDMAAGGEDGRRLEKEMSSAIEAEMASRGFGFFGRCEGAAEQELREIAQMARSQELDAARAMEAIEAWMLGLELGAAISESESSKGGQRL